MCICSHAFSPSQIFRMLSQMHLTLAEEQRVWDVSVQVVE